MNEPKHTPGPWTYKRIKYRGYTAIKSVIAESGKEVARITDDYSCVEDADARLIASAPDLLEAAKHALVSLRDHPDLHEGTKQELINAIVGAGGWDDGLERLIKQ